jgi:hypothetical protein
MSAHSAGAGGHANPICQADSFAGPPDPETSIAMSKTRLTYSYTLLRDHSRCPDAARHGSARSSLPWPAPAARLDLCGPLRGDAGGDADGP